MVHEYAQIKATLFGFESKEYSCGDCQARYGGRPEAFLNKGCKEARPFTVAKIGDDLKFTRCPGNYHSPSVSHWYRAYLLYEKGVMPFSGSFVEQPAKIIEMFSVMENWKLDRELREQKKQAQKAKVSGGG